MESKCADTHDLALELLDIVHKICVKENILYTLSGETLIKYETSSFSYPFPIIHISLMYENFIRLKECLKNFCENNARYSIQDFSNTEQFNTVDTWFVKLPNSELKINSSYSFYYGPRLIITPLFFAGNSYKEWNKTYSKYKNKIATFNLSALLPQQSLINYIRQLPKKLIVSHYVAQKDKYRIDDIMLELAKLPFSKYILYPYIVPKFHGCNSIPWVVNKKTFRLTYEWWNNVREIEFYGVKCYCVINSSEFLKCFPTKYIKETISQKNQLLSEGGEKLRRIQLTQLELLIEFDRICRRNNLRYNISFGTLLGAVRHKGFIPWDDDIDVTMPLDDYIKLDNAMERELNNEKYYYRTPKTEENNHLIFKHLERKGTVYTKPGREKLKNKIGIFIDIFPMYPAAPNFILDWFQAKICKFWRTALWATVGAESEKNRLKRLYYKLIAKFGNKYCYKKFVECATIFKNKKGRLKFWIAMDRNPYNVALVNEENYIKTTELEFEGHKFLAPENYTEVLNYCFGKDWRHYPELRKRIPQHNAIIDFGEIYKDVRGDTK